ncbi:hypothetical protein NDU88_005171 [Pleurodeles waltl]|uniref:Uncharacterized protein n=1 Tax=Pleurodeles waltl TaxID=8319 RepID=A0AAV7L0F4_PLEWA|nr:hypothetical protein NDU88_005171 [Pleurodeles waltl]
MIMSRARQRYAGECDLGFTGLQLQAEGVVILDVQANPGAVLGRPGRDQGNSGLCAQRPVEMRIRSSCAQEPRGQSGLPVAA